MNFFAITGILIGIIGVFEAFIVFLKSQNKVHYLWGVFCISFIMWGLGSYEVAIAKTPEVAIFWWKISYIGVIFIPIFLLHFIYAFLGLKNKLLILFAYLAGFVFLYANLFTNTFINDVRWMFGQFYYLSSPTILYNIFVGFFLALVVFSVIKMWQAFRHAENINKVQLKYIVISLIIGFGGGSFSFLPVYNINLYPFPNVLISVGTILVAYTIFKYRFMDLRVLVRQAFIYVGLAFLTYVIFYLVAWFYLLMFDNIFIRETYLLGLIITPLFIFLLFRVEGLLQKIANRYLFFDLYNYQETLNNLSKELTYYTDVEKIISLIITTIKKTIQLNLVEVTLIGYNNSKVIRLLDNDFLIKYLDKNKKPLIKEELRLIIKDTKTVQEKKKLEDIYDRLEKSKVSICLPLVSGGKVIGMLILGSKRSNDAYSREDLNLLDTLANQASITITNAQQYKKIREFNRTLKQKVTEQTKNISEKNRYLEELLAMKSDFLKVVNHQLNTPLSIMRNAYSMVKEGTFSPEKAFDYSSAGLERLSETIADFWDAYELEGNKMKINPEKTNIIVIVNSLIKEKQKMKLAQERGIKINAIKPKFVVPVVWCDLKKITHVISNLLDNTVYYTYKGKVTVSYELLDKYLKINIVDTGVGISKANEKRLFQKFSRGEGSTNLHPDGSGLGLYITKKIVEGSDGELTYFSAGENKGSTFSFTLPIYTNQKADKDSDNISRDDKMIVFSQNQKVKK